MRVLVAAIAFAACFAVSTQDLPSETVRLVQTRLDVVTSAQASPTPVEQDGMKTLYEGSGQAPIWVDWAGRPSSRTRDALALLARSSEEGLDPADYDTAGLQSLAARLMAAPAPQPADAASFDLVLSATMLRYLNDLSGGRVDPQSVGFRLDEPAARHDVAMALRRAIEADRIAALVEEMAPPLPQYRALKAMLARYRALAVHASLDALPAPQPKVDVGDRYAGIRALHRRLQVLGDLPAEIPAPSEDALYDGALVQGVKTFQRRHGLEPDGIIGKATWSALSVPLTWRVRQIELALERLRWLPDPDRERLVVLNIPMFRVSAWDSPPAGGKPALVMRAIVGQAARTQTPVFMKSMHAVIFRPYWNIPTSILRNEILPALARDADYLQREDMEIVRGAGDDARPVAVTEENIALLKQGTLRLRQRPGPGNALGLIKFVFPNEEHVYLHDTPAKRLFLRSRRDLSHGCVRVEDPVGLAEWVFAGEPEWTRERILAATADSEHVSRFVSLKRPIRVILFYMTAVAAADSTMQFADDIYGHDRTLDKALARSSAQSAAYSSGP